MNLYSMKRVLGVFLLLLPFITMLTLVIFVKGLEGALVFFVSMLISLSVVAGSYLLYKKEEK